MRERLKSAVGRAGRRVDVAIALVVGGWGAAQLLTETDQAGALTAGLAAALAVACVALVIRRRDPLAAAVAAGAVWFVPGVVVGPSWSNGAPLSASLAIVVLAYMLGAHEPRMRGLIGLAALVLGFSAGEFSDPVPPFLFTVPAWIAGEAVQARSRLAAQLDARARELDEEREAFALEAVRYERTRIARELHDIVAHSLSMMVVQAGAGQRQLASKPAEAAQSLEHVSGAARQAELELGQLLELLGEDSPRADGGMRLIDELVRQAGASGLAVTCRFSGQQDALPADLSETAYRVAQEGLTNALKHAPGAPVQVALDARERAAVITVENGPPPQSAASELQNAGGHHGIRGMRERVGDCGGTLEAGPTADGGWRIAARLPLSQPATTTNF
jgi:signal transduction histidine kinase